MKTIKQLEKEIQQHEDFMSNPDPDTMEEAFEGDVEQFENDFRGLQLKSQLSYAKAFKKMIEDKINKIATDKKELALAEHKRACCMMTLKEILSKIEGEDVRNIKQTGRKGK